VAPHLGRDAADEVVQLETSRPHDDVFWSSMNGLPFDSWTEKRFMVKLGLAKGQLVRVAPARAGASARVVDGRSGADIRHRPQNAMVLSLGGLDAVIWPQRPVRGRTAWKLDGLAVVAAAGRKLTVNIEIDGPQHDPLRDLFRQEDFNLPTLRYSAATVNAPGFIKRLFTDLRTLLGAQ
jgi:hypothetical protein